MKTYDVTGIDKIDFDDSDPINEDWRLTITFTDAGGSHTALRLPLSALRSLKNMVIDETLPRLFIGQLE